MAERIYIAPPEGDILATTSDSIAIANILLNKLFADREEVDVNIAVTALAYCLIWLANAAKGDPADFAAQFAGFVAAESGNGSVQTVQ